MRYLAVYFTALLLLLIVLPWALVGWQPAAETTEPAAILQQSVPSPASLATLPAQPPSAQDQPNLGDHVAGTVICLWRSLEQRSEWIALEEYVARVVAAEMPALFQEAALMAQAVAVRTYTLKHLQQQDKRSAHPGGDLCDQPGHCQAYASPEELRLNWQSAYDVHWQRISEAVQSTAALVLSYRGQLIDALYHSTCGGRTEYSGEVWGGNQASRPYLVAVDCPWDRGSQRYSGSVFYSWDELGRRLGLSEAAAQVSWLGSSAWTVTAYSDGGRVEQAILLGEEFSGTKLRGSLGLNSTNLSVTQSSAGLTFQTIGYGHGVGLCQYGADGYAKTGANYIEILGHYYQGVVVVEYQNVER